METKRDIHSILKEFSRIKRNSLIPILQEVQKEYGYLPEDSIKHISEYLNLPAIKVYGLATFYNQFRFSPPGKYHIKVCDGTGCHLEGSGQVVKEIGKILNIMDGETTRDGVFSLEILSCIGACDYGPVISVNGIYYKNMDNNAIKELIKILGEQQ